MPSRRTTSSSQSPDPSSPTAPIMWTSDSSRAAATAWFSPLPPGWRSKAEPNTVSPAPGIRSSWTTRSMFKLPTTATRLCIWAILPRVTDDGAALGVDLGTGSVKVAVVSPNGTVQAKASRGYSLSSPHPGWADTRAGGEAANMQAELGDEVLARLGSPAVSGFAATSLRWVARNEPAALKAATYALQPKDWLRARLGGDVVTEPSDASGTLLANVAAGAWDEVALSWAGVDPALLAPIVGSRAAAGAITLGGHELPCVAGAADTAAAIVGFGLSINDGFTAVGSGSQSVSLVAEH